MFLFSNDPNLINEEETERKCQGMSPDHVIYGFKQYQTNIKGYFSFAINILESLKTNFPITEVLVIGHADVDIAQPTPILRKKKEDSVSKERAQNAYKALKKEVFMQLWKIKGLEAELPRWGYCGVGTKKLLVTRPITENDRKLNRRIELFFKRELRNIRPKNVIANCMHGGIIERVKQKDPLNPLPSTEDVFMVFACHNVILTRGEMIHAPCSLVVFTNSKRGTIEKGSSGLTINQFGYSYPFQVKSVEKEPIPETLSAQS